MNEKPADLFDEFWAAYPKRVGKGDARKAWAKLKPSPADLVRMLQAIAWQSKTPQWTKNAGQFIPYPASWLRQERWEDEPFNPPDQTEAAWNDFNSRLSRE